MRGVGITDEKAIGATGSDIADNSALLLAAEVTMRQSSKDKRRVPLTGTPRRLVQDGRAGSQKIGTEALSRANFQQFAQEIDARDARLCRQTKRSRAPNDAHAIDADNVAVGYISGEHGIGTHVHKLRDIESNVLQTLTSSHGLARQVDRLGHRQNIDGTS
ncbi:hypothetical protein ACVWZ6_004579 [Bradyrhizobium sp. GM6.1]